MGEVRMPKDVIEAQARVRELEAAGRNVLDAFGDYEKYATRKTRKVTALAGLRAALEARPSRTPSQQPDPTPKESGGQTPTTR